MNSEVLIKQIKKNVKDHPYWKSYLRTRKNNVQPKIHLAIFVEPYLQYIFEGKKTIEARFSSKRIAPYQKVDKGDIIILKQSGGPVVGLCEVSQVWSYLLEPKSWNYVKKEFTRSLCAQDQSFWNQRKSASYATLMKIKNVVSLEPIFWKKQDRRGWVVIDQSKPEKPDKFINL